MQSLGQGWEKVALEVNFKALLAALDLLVPEFETTDAAAALLRPRWPDSAYE